LNIPLMHHVAAYGGLFHRRDAESAEEGYNSIVNINFRFPEDQVCDVGIYQIINTFSLRPLRLCGSCIWPP